MPQYAFPSNSTSMTSITSITSSNSSPSPSPSPIGLTPSHKASSGIKPNGAPPLPPSNKPNVPNSKPLLGSRLGQASPGPLHPTSKPPPPPSPKTAPPPIPQNKSNLHSTLRHPPSRATSKSFNTGRAPATFGPGPQGRTPLPGSLVSQDDSSIRNGQLSKPPPPPARTVSQPTSRGAPPPPPTNKRPSQPPPPPPTNPPRPPTRELPPPPPSHGGSSEPPTPPMRRESINRAGPGSSGYNSSASSGGESFEARFSGKFRSMQYLPPPEPFNRCQKTYPSKTK